jgi:hypothetical protein
MKWKKKNLYTGSPFNYTWNLMIIRNPDVHICITKDPSHQFGNDRQQNSPMWVAVKVKQKFNQLG